MKNIAILGSTGSIGCNALEIVDNLSHRFRVAGLAAGRNLRLFLKQIEKFKPKVVSLDRQEEAAELVSLLSEGSRVPLKDFGIHGSVGLNMHSIYSDIDLVVYGSQNFRKLEKTVDRLVEEENLKYVFTKKVDKARKHRGRYKDRRFVYTAVRKLEEITVQYGRFKYKPIKNVTFNCRVVDDSENMFRPAIYQIRNYQPHDPASELTEEQVPTKVLSMIGYYRNVARQGEGIKVSGNLERVENVETGEVHYQVVVGTATREKEYIEPLSH